MSKFVSYKPGEVINGDGSVSPATIFVTEDGQEEAIVTGSPIEKLLLADMGVVTEQHQVEVEPVVPSEVPVDEAPIAPLMLPAAGESSATEMASASNDGGVEVITT